MVFRILRVLRKMSLGVDGIRFFWRGWFDLENGGKVYFGRLGLDGY